MTRRAPLRAAPLTVRGAAAVSGYPDDWPELDQAGWHRTLLTRRSTIDPGKPARVEAVWTNYQPLPAQTPLFPPSGPTGRMAE